MRQEGLYPYATPPRPLTPPLCRQAAVEHHMTTLATPLAKQIQRKFTDGLFDRDSSRIRVC